jgi:hypothetical protein
MERNNKLDFELALLAAHSANDLIKTYYLEKDADINDPRLLNLLKIQEYAHLIISESLNMEYENEKLSMKEAMHKKQEVNKLDIRPSNEFIREIICESENMFITSIGDYKFPVDITPKVLDNITTYMLTENHWCFAQKRKELEKYLGPVRSSYFVLVHPDMAPDFYRMSGFIGWAFYPNSSTLLESEIGTRHNLRFIVGNDSLKGLDGNYCCLVFGDPEGEKYEVKDFVVVWATL